MDRIPENPTIASYLKRVSIFLEDGDWVKADEYCEKVLDIDPENADAYLGKLMAQLHVSQQEQLAEQAQPFNHLDACKKAVRFGDEELKATLTAYSAHAAARNEEHIYQTGCTWMAHNTVEGYQNAIAEFNKIPNCKGVPQLIAECRQKAENIQKEAVYQNGCVSMARNTIEGYQNATAEFSKIPDYKDAAMLAQESAQSADALREEAKRQQNKRNRSIVIIASCACVLAIFVIILFAVIIPNSKYNDAVALMDAGKYDEAIEAFQAMDGYKDSNNKIEQCRDALYNKALDLLKSGKEWEALAIFNVLDAHKDSAKQVNALRAKLTQRDTLSAGVSHTVAIKNKGTVVEVGFNFDGECNVHDWTDIIAVSAGGSYTLALKADGTVVATGDNNAGQCDVSGWTDIIAVSAGGSYTLGLKADGTVVAVGDNKYGQCDVAGWKDIVAVSAGWSHTIGLKADGTVVSVGRNDMGQCDVDGWTDIIAVDASDYHTVGLKADGTMVVTGFGSNGECNVSGWTNIVAISVSANHTVGLKANGTVVATGENYHGECNVSGWTDIVAISAGIGHTVGLKADGTVVAVGDDYSDGRCDVSGWTDIKRPE